MKGNFLMLIVTIISMGQSSFCAITTITPDGEIAEQNQYPYPESNFVNEYKANFEDENPSNFVDELNSLLSSFQIREKHESPFDQHENDNAIQLSDENHEYSTRGVNYRRNSKKCKGKRRFGGRRFRRKGRGNNGHGNRGGGGHHREVNDQHSEGEGGGQHHELHDQHLGEGGGGGGGIPQLGEASSYQGISAQAAVIGAGSTINGVAVTTGAVLT